MHPIHFEILEQASRSSSGGYVDVSPLLIKYFPIPDNSQVRDSQQEIMSIISFMSNEGLIETFNNTAIHYIGRSGPNRIEWLEDIPIELKLLPKGYIALTEEQNRIQNKELSDSVIKTNKSVAETNRRTTRLAKWNLGTAILNLAAVIIIACLTLRQSNDNKEDVKQLKMRLELLEDSVVTKHKI